MSSFFHVGIISFSSNQLGRSTMASNIENESGDKKRKASAYLRTKANQIGLFDPPSSRRLQTDAFVNSETYDRMCLVMDNVVGNLVTMGDPRRWKPTLSNPLTLRVVLKTLSVGVENHHQWMQEASLTHSTTITPAMELSRRWIIQLRDPDVNEWFSLYEVKKSTIENSGYGLFAARPYKAHDILGVFFGEVSDLDEDGKVLKKKEKVDRKKGGPGNYAMIVEWPGQSNKYLLIDPKGEPTKNYERGKGCHPAYFGLHMANDPDWSKKKKARKNLAKTTRSTRQSPTVNMIVDEKLVGRALEDIAVDEEIFLDYDGDVLDESCTRK